MCHVNKRQDRTPTKAPAPSTYRSTLAATSVRSLIDRMDLRSSLDRPLRSSVDR